MTSPNSPEGAIVHIAEHHGARTATRSDSAQLATIPFIFIGSYGSSPDVAMPVGMLPRQRANESAADLIAVNLLADAGYAPEGLVHYIARVQRDPTRANFSPYPPRDERIQAILKRFPRASEDLHVFGRFREDSRRGSASHAD